MTQRLPTLGFWFNPAAPNAYPRPQALVGGWDPVAQAQVVAHLRAGRTFATYGAASFCRFACGVADAALGRRDLTDGAWVWPEGLAHYVADHDVRLPDDFVAHVAAAAAAPPSSPGRGPTARGRRLPRMVAGSGSSPTRSVGRRLDDGPWLAWARAQGACLDLAGWEVPDARTRARIAADLAADLDADLGDADLALCRGDTRQVVLALADGALEIRQLRPDGHPPRRLPGWHAWPIAR